MSTDSDSSQRVVPGSANPAPAPWPATAVTPATAIDAPAVAHRLVSALNDALATGNYGAVAELFLPDPKKTDPATTDTDTDTRGPTREHGDGQGHDGATAFWRDHLAVSWRLRTVKGRDAIKGFLQEQGQKLKQQAGFDGGVGGKALLRLEVDAGSAFRSPQAMNLRPAGQVVGVAFYMRVENAVGGVGRGVVRCAEVGEGEWRIWTLFTTLEGVKGWEERTGPRREMGVLHGEIEGRKNWVERRAEEREFVREGPEVLIIGAGQTGLTAAARLKMLGVPALAIDKNKAVGDNWRKRYHQLVLHDPVWYDHMPYIPFPESWPVFTPKDKLADWFESYVKALDLNVWTQSEMVSSAWDETKKEWTVTIKRVRDDGRAETRTFHPKHIVLAIGHTGKKYMPSIPGMDSFQGDLLCHSSEFPGASAHGNHKKAVVIGACNSSLDICQDYVEKGYDVTVVQRSSTYVVSSDGILKVSLGVLYEEGGPPTEDSDIAVWAWPSEILKSVQVDLTTILAERDRDMLEGLERAGFKTDMGPHRAGIFAKYLQRGGGYYIDVGGAKLIIDGRVKVKHGQEVAQILPRGVKFADGTELEADEIVFATGYENMKAAAQAVLGDALVAGVEGVWGWDHEGEMRTIWTSSGHPGLWFHGGNMSFCRYYSRLVALQIKASIEGSYGKA